MSDHTMKDRDCPFCNKKEMLHFREDICGWQCWMCKEVVSTPRLYEMEDEDDPNITDQQLFGVVYPFDPDNVELY